MNLVTTIEAMKGGADAVTGIGMDFLFSFTDAFQTGDEITLTFTDAATGLQTQIGAGWATGAQLDYLLTLGEKVYGIAGRTVYFSAIGNPTLWNDPNAAGNSFLQTSNNYGIAEDLMALAIYQGKLAIVGRSQVQIEAVDADPANNNQSQVLPNIGTVAKETVQAIGDMDLYMLADNGVRSVRVRDASNNAILSDVGTPIDAIVQPLLASLTDAQKATSCGIVEPACNRYWVYIPKPDGSTGSIYVFSYFPSSEIAAWGTYEPSYQVPLQAINVDLGLPEYDGLTIGATYYWKPGVYEKSFTCGTLTLTAEGIFVATDTTATVVLKPGSLAYTGALSQKITFIPSRFVVFKGQVYARSGDKVFQLGGADNTIYDACGVSWIMPFVDEGSPGTRKYFEGVDLAFEGNWTLSGCTDYTVNRFKPLYVNNAPSFLLGGIGWGVTGTHYSFRGDEFSDAYARFSSVLCHTRPADEK